MMKEVKVLSVLMRLYLTTKAMMRSRMVEYTQLIYIRSESFVVREGVRMSERYA